MVGKKAGVGSGRCGSQNQVAVAVAEEVGSLDPKRVTEVGQQRLKAREVGILWRSNALELNEVSEAIDPVEMNPHAFVDEELSGFSNHGHNPERAGQRGLETDVVLDLDDPVVALPLAGRVGTLVGDQVGARTPLPSQLQTTPGDIEVGVLLAENAPGLGAQPFTDLA